MGVTSLKCKGKFYGGVHFLGGAAGAKLKTRSKVKRNKALQQNNFVSAPFRLNIMTRWILLAFTCACGSVCSAQLTKKVDYSLIYDLSYIRDTATNEYHHGYKCLSIRSGSEGRFRDLNAHFNDSMRTDFEQLHPGFSTGQLPQKRLAQVIEKYDAASAKWRKPTSNKFRIVKDYKSGTSSIVLIRGVTPQHLEQPLNLDYNFSKRQHCRDVLFPGHGLLRWPQLRGLV